jgi:MFS family permease
MMYPIGKLTDRFGTKSLLFGMVILYSLFFLLFAFFTADRMPLIVAGWCLAGVADGIFGIAATSTLYHSLPHDQRRTSSLALAQGLPIILLGIGPFIVRIYLEYTRNLRFTVFGQEIEQFRFLYAFCGLLVLSSLWFLKKVDDTHDVRLTQLVWQGMRDGFVRLQPKFWRWPDQR